MQTSNRMVCKACVHVCNAYAPKGFYGGIIFGGRGNWRVADAASSCSILERGQGLGCVYCCAADACHHHRVGVATERIL